MSSVADLVARLVAAGTPPELAAVVVTEAFAAGAACGKSGGIPVDEAAERRRAYDRDRKRVKAEFHRKSVEPPRNSTPPLNLTSSPSANTEVEKEVKKVRARKPVSVPLPVDWQPKPAHFDAAAKRGMAESAVLEKAVDMRLWAKSKGELKVDWDATFHGFIRRDAGKGTQSNAKSGIIDAADRALESLRRQEREATDSGAGIGGPPPFRLISQG